MMIRKTILLRAASLAVISMCVLAVAQDATLRVTVLYDNTAARQECAADWGFAALVEGTEKTILFDTGTKAEVLLKNVDVLKAGLSKSGAVVISHAHADHTGGLKAVLPRIPGVNAFLPASSPSALVESVSQAGGLVTLPKGPVTVCKDVWLTGEMGEQIKEQALVIGTPRGLVVLTGCSHPGIVKILDRAVEVGNQKLYAVMGGFHLLQHSDAAVEEIIGRFRELRVGRVGASHCTGEKAIAAFRKAYGANFIELGAGRVVSID